MVTFVMGALVFLMLIGAFMKLSNIGESQSVPMQDTERLKEELQLAKAPGCFEVLTKGGAYRVKLFPIGNQVKECARRACLCLLEAGQSPRCKDYILKGVEKDKEKCEKGRCVLTPSTVNVVQGKPIMICNEAVIIDKKTFNTLSIGDGCDCPA